MTKYTATLKSLSWLRLAFRSLDFFSSIIIITKSIPATNKGMCLDKRYAIRKASLPDLTMYTVPAVKAIAQKLNTHVIMSNSLSFLTKLEASYLNGRQMP